MTLLRFLFYAAVIYLLVRWLGRVLNPPPAPPREGESRVDFTPPKKEEKVVGEYVDFEEIPDDEKK